MTPISTVPENPEVDETLWRAVAGGKESLGRTAGEALDALTAQLEGKTSGALVFVQRFCPDQFFTAEQQQRLTELMSRWRSARDLGKTLAPEEQAELEGLVEAQLEGSAQRAEEMLRSLTS